MSTDVPIVQMAKTKGPPTQVGAPRELISVGPEERARLKAQRIKLELRQEDLAMRVGVTPATISNLEGTRSKQIKKTVYAKIYRVLFGRRDANETIAVDKDAAFREIVEGALDLDETKQRAVAELIKNLKGTKEA